MKKYMTLSHKKIATCLAAVILCFSEATYSHNETKTMDYSVGTPRAKLTTVHFASNCWGTNDLLNLTQHYDSIPFSSQLRHNLLEQFIDGRGPKTWVGCSPQPSN